MCVMWLLLYKRKCLCYNLGDEYKGLYMQKHCFPAGYAKALNRHIEIWGLADIFFLLESMECILQNTCEYFYDLHLLFLLNLCF